MENLEPKREERSPISSLKFQRKSDYKKFRNFIKKETKELKGIEAPKDNKLKSILKVGAGGLGFLALGGIIGAIKGKDNEDTSGKFKTPFIIGRRSPSDLPDLDKLSLFDKPTKITPDISNFSKIPKPVKTLVSKPVKTIQTTLLNSKQFSRIQEKSKELVASGKSKSRGSGKMGASAADKDFFKRLKLDPKFGERGMGVKNLGAMTVGEAEKLIADIFPGGKLNKNPQTLSRQAMNQALELISPGKIQDLFPEIQSNLGTAANIDAGKDALLDRIADFSKDMDNTPELRMDPSYNRVTIKAEMTFEYMKKRLSQLKSKGSKIFDTLSKTTQKLTPQFLKSDLVKPLFKSKTKTGFFVIDLLFAGQAFADLFKPKDNLRTSVVDLFNAYNNLKYKDDPSKLKYYITESSDERIRAFHIQKNKEIRLLKEKANVDLGGPQNILIVPDNKQNNEVKTDTSIKKGETKISFVPFEPVNSVGTGILLHKLNA